VQTLLRREAARHGRTIDYRVIVSNFDAAFRAVAAGLAVGIMPMLEGEQFGALRRIKLVPLTDRWARRRFIVCYRTWADLAPAAQRMVEHLTQR
jgi:DNA-binding transcriptional LysR family regulator